MRMISQLSVISYKIGLSSFIKKIKQCAVSISECVYLSAKNRGYLLKHIKFLQTLLCTNIKEEKEDFQLMSIF